ncbi:hypothetical protein RRF57_006374 [Xylaria bambusicola]|uniref:EthD domain-containing protein n=1 Tax=Xylaria bambusicola TaxID=326684 RepID=A0AAN7USE3_9PEZI
MIFSILVFMSRKPGTTPEQFRNYYTGSHLPMFRKLVGPHFAVRHVRRYIHRIEAPRGGAIQRNSSTPASVLLGSQADFNFDVVATVDLKTAADFWEHCDFAQQPDIGASASLSRF